jgi:hypothetical protein
MGPLQLMPGTASDMGVSNPYNPAANIDGGLHYFSNILNNQAHGDYRTAAMGYNAGPNRSGFPQSAQAYANKFMARIGNTDPVQGPYYAGGASMPQPDPLAPLPGDPPMPPPNPATLGALNKNFPGNFGDPSQQGAFAPSPSLASLANGPARKPNRLNFGNIAGILGDALMAYDKMPPQFAPFMREQQILGQQQNFEMQKYRQQIAMQMYLMSNGLDTETGKQLIAAGVQPGTPEWQAGMARSASNSLDPVVNTAQGPVLRSSVVPHFDPQAVAMLREAMAKGDHAAAQEFDEHFGRGSALQALGQQ